MRALGLRSEGIGFFHITTAYRDSFGDERRLVARWYMIGGVRFYRRSLVKLSADERAALTATGRAVLRRPVEWPLPDHTPDFARAYTDPGGTDLWGPGPYLKVPSRIAGDDDWEPLNRVFCPWGYPPDRVRVAHSALYLQLAAVELARVWPAVWEWVLSVVPWVPAAEQQRHAEPLSGLTGLSKPEDSQPS